MVTGTKMKKEQGKRKKIKGKISSRVSHIGTPNTEQGLTISELKNHTGAITGKNQKSLIGVPCSSNKKEKRTRQKIKGKNV